jgi:hypothetical protein
MKSEQGADFKSEYPAEFVGIRSDAFAGVMVLSEVRCLMMQFGSGASTFGTTFA